jgi:uncharacterized protein YndB with AHSA1/START domain
LRLAIDPYPAHTAGPARRAPEEFDMKWLKRLLIGVLALAALLVGGGLLLSPRYHLERSVIVEAPADTVYGLVADPHQWPTWTVWNRRDPGMKISYFGEPSGAGSGWSWQSATEGDGKMTLTAVTPGQRVAYDLYFPDMDSTSTGEVRFELDGRGTRVTWTLDGDMGANPLYRWMGLLMDRLVGPDFEAGLANLKAVAEKP